MALPLPTNVEAAVVEILVCPHTRRCIPAMATVAPRTVPLVQYVDTPIYLWNRVPSTQSDIQR